jgi:hypothetical protein
VITGGVFGPIISLPGLVVITTRIAKSAEDTTHEKEKMFLILNLHQFRLSKFVNRQNHKEISL